MQEDNSVSDRRTDGRRVSRDRPDRDDEETPTTKHLKRIETRDVQQASGGPGAG